jgi:hypothetical protein
MTGSGKSCRYRLKTPAIECDEICCGIFTAKGSCLFSNSICNWFVMAAEPDFRNRPSVSKPIYIYQ